MVKAMTPSTERSRFHRAYLGIWMEMAAVSWMIIIAAMGLTMWVVSVVVLFVFGYRVFRGRSRVGSIWFWTILLIISAIVAPLTGEIGTASWHLDACD